MIKKFLILIGLLLILWPMDAKAAVGEYIDSMNSKISVNKDSSLDIEEEINYFFPSPRHGIFRILPTKFSPIRLISITDQNNVAIPYTQSKSNSDHTITWKIGDADKTIEGLQTYKIHYRVLNAIRFDNPNFDEFYWNLNGNFWEVPINQYSAKITFPTDITEQNSEIFIYSGAFGIKDAGLTNYNWDDNTLSVQSTHALAAGEGVTVSVSTPKNIFTPYVPGFFEKYGQYFFLIVPLFLLLLGFNLWRKHGRDPKIVGPILPEFGVPQHLSPMEIGVLISNGKLLSPYISAGIVNLAVKKVIKIEQTDKKNYKLLLRDDGENPDESEKILIDKLFGGKKEITTEDLKNNFYDKISAIETNIADKLKVQGLHRPTVWWTQTVFIILAMISFMLLFYISSWGWAVVLSLISNIVILVIFTVLMPRRTLEGAKLMKKVEGFKLYMKTAERYRQEFNEKENIFEKFLPYAMVFGIVSEWTKSFAKIYQEIHHQDYFAGYHPVWFASAVSGNFDPDIFSANITNLSSHMSSTLASSPSSSGSGGGGFSGGGGGGGGGGSW